MRTEAHADAYPRSAACPQRVGDIRAHAWAFAFECYRKKEGARPGAPDDGTESKEDSADAPIVQD